MAHDGDAAPPPIRRLSREALQVQDYSIVDEDSDDAAPPPIARGRPSSFNSTKRLKRPTHIALTPVPTRNPLRSHPPDPSPPTYCASPADKTNPTHAIRKPAPPRQPSSLISRNLSRPPYRNNPKLAPSLQRWSSLETIDSVTTSQSVYEEDDRRDSIVSASTGVSTFKEDDASSIRHEPTLHMASVGHSSDTSSIRSGSTSTRSDVPHNRSNNSLMRIFKPRQTREPLLAPEHLEITREVSMDQRVERTRSSDSSSSGLTISSGRPSDLKYRSGDRTVQEERWKSSDYDITSLSEAELIKCKKKGINPALYLEMKAARKGKWKGSPIAGNSIF